MSATAVGLSGHNTKAWFCAICELFVAARGSLEQRLSYKREMKRATELLGIAWSKALEWFRETVGKIELHAREELEAQFKNKFAFLAQ